MTPNRTAESHAAEEHLGAVEGERETDAQPGNANAPGLDDEWMPNDRVKICEDVIGATEDETTG